MGMMIGSLNSSRKVISVRNVDGSTAGTITVTGPKKKKPKKFQYNFKQISARILESKTSGSARMAIVMARSKAGMLRRQLKSGEYDSKEIESALIHAEKMVRIAKKRQKHLQEEERAERSGDTTAIEEWEEELAEDPEMVSEEDLKVSKEKLRELMQEMQELLEEAMKESMDSLEEACGPEELSEELLGSFEDLEPEELEMRKKKHRMDELREIMEADMKYLKALFDRLEKEKSDVSSGVSLELGGVEVPIAPVEEPVMTEGGIVDVSV